MVQLRLLGSAEIVGSDGRNVGALRQPKRMALLAYLAVARPRGFHRRDKVLSIFWPELDEHRARNSLSQALHVLRTAVGEGVVLTRGEDEIAVAGEQLRCDVIEFEQAANTHDGERALSLYRGDFLDGLNVSGAPDFERWVDTERMRLRQLASRAGWCLAEQQRDAGDLLSASEHARLATKLLPLDETQIRRLILFLREIGDRSGAVRVYEEFARELARDYDLEPSSETQALANAIRSEPTTQSTASHRRIAHGPPVEAKPESGLLLPVRQRRSRRALIAGILLVAALAVGLAVERPRGRLSPSPIVRFSLTFEGVPALATGIAGSTIALSPDGTRLVYVGVGARGTELFARSMDRLQSTPIPHTENAHLPFFSPSGEWLGFVAGDAIQAVNVGSGALMTICKASTNVAGASWGGGNVIVFATPAGLWRVAATGGTPRLITPNDSANRTVYRWPAVLPGAKASVVTRIDDSGFHLVTVALETGAVTPLGIDGTSPYFVEPGFLVFARADGILRAIRFDAEALRFTGAPLPIGEGVIVGIAGAVKLGVSRAGVLASVPEPPSSRVVIVDRAGRARALPIPPQEFFNVRYAPDGRRIAVSTAMVGGQADVWVFDQLTKGRRPVTFDSASVTPVWTADGGQLIVATKPRGRQIGFAIRAVAVDSSAPSQSLLAAAPGQLPYAVTPDGKSLLFGRLRTGRTNEIWVLPLDGSGTPTPYLRGPFNRRAAAIAPNGRWLAYVSDESGRDEVYVRHFPDDGGVVTISAGGGREPRWSASGTELFYRSDSQMIGARVEAASLPRVISRQNLFDHRPYESWVDGAAYDVHPDGEHFVMIRRAPERRDIVVVLNWFDSLRSGGR